MSSSVYDDEEDDDGIGLRDTGRTTIPQDELNESTEWVVSASGY